MAKTLIGTFGLPEALKAEGFPLPDDCREARVIMGLDSPLMIQFDCFLDEDKTAKLGRALVRLAEDNQK